MTLKKYWEIMIKNKQILIKINKYLLIYKIIIISKNVLINMEKYFKKYFKMKT